jgi:aryl-alcohol dehydrogenase-like predicted oxidoreductase
MIKRKLGSTNLEVSIIGFGGIPISYLPLNEAIEVIKYAFNKGINFFDTARAYGDSEEKIGNALRDVREKCIIATKTHHKTKEEATKKGLEISLSKLKTDRIDLVQLHGIDDEDTLKKAISKNGSLSALKEAKRKGIIDFIGISSHNPEILYKALKTNEFDTVMVPFNLANRDAEKIFPLIKEMNIGLIIMKPFGGPLNERSLEMKKLLNGDLYSSAKKALSFILNYEEVSTIIPGFSSKEEIDAAINVLSLY